MKSKSPVLKKAFSEVFSNPPKVTQGKSPEAARKQKVAIAFSKARAKGYKDKGY